MTRQSRPTTQQRAVRKGLCFPLQINFGVDVGGVDGDLPEPSTNGVDVHACAQEMSGGGVSTILPARSAASSTHTQN